MIAVVVVIVVVAIALAAGKDNSNNKSVQTPTASQPSDVPIQYAAAKQQGKAGSMTWQGHCDTSTGYVAMPVLNAAPCVPKFTGDNGGAINAPAVTADTIRIGYYIAKPDPQQDYLLQRAGAYDPPANVEQTIKDYVQMFQSLYETYGRKIQLVKIQGTGLQTDEVAARNDAETAAKQDHVFAVIGGPAQAKSFAETLAANHVLCVGTCTIAAPQSFFEQRRPYIWSLNPSPEQTSSMMVEFIKKQLLDKNAQYAGDPAFRNKKRTFALLSYDTPEGQYRDSWNNFADQLKAAGVPLVLHKSYYLDITRIPQVAKDVAVALKQANATSVIFTGDPIMPSYFTAQATAQNYFPEWIMAGTVFADTSVFARTFDQKQWAHAFGLQLTPTRVVQSKWYPYTVHQWFFHGAKPPADKGYAVVYGNVALLFAGIQVAGPHLTPANFEAGMYATAPPEPANGRLDTVITYGDHGFWQGNDPNGLDNAGILWWDPNATGEDETGVVGKGMYRLVDGGKRYVPGGWPTDPVKLFDPAGTVTIYKDLPPQLMPKSYPPPGS